MSAPTDFSAMACSFARSFAAVGDPWKAVILRDVGLGLHRFDELAEDLGISRKVLTERLGQLVADGVLERRLYQEHPPRFEYHLTESGRDVIPALLAMMAWGDRWRAGEAGPPVRLRHLGHRCEPQVVCRTCSEPLELADVTARPGPGGQVGPGTWTVGESMMPAGRAAVGMKARAR